MKTLYNIYYQNRKINKRMISKEDVDKLLCSKFIYKRIETGKIDKISVNDIVIKKCTII